MDNLSLDFESLRRHYAQKTLCPTRLVEILYQRIERCATANLWISLLPVEEARTQARRLEGVEIDALPLYGIPFAIKDNIDVAGYATTVGCPAFAFLPEATAPVVEKLLAAGAILIGKSNLDQFATGLVGARSPYGAVATPFDPAYIAGGSSSGSAAAVAAGLVSFALGSDTAGSGRVPAGFNNVVGLKPTRGLISATGLFPACRSLDCVSIFALTCDDAATVLDVAQGFDAADPYSRTRPPQTEIRADHRVRFGVPAADQLCFFGNEEYAALFARAVADLRALGGEVVEIDFFPFQQAGQLLYQGPWVAERYAAIREFIQAQPQALLDVTRQIIGQGERYTAIDLFEAIYQLQHHRQRVDAVWAEIDCLVAPTAGTHYTLAEVAADPLGTNSNLGYYTNFVNLLDLSALAVPAGFTEAGLPFGITLIAPAFAEERLHTIGARFQQRRQLPLGATGLPTARQHSTLTLDGKDPMDDDRVPLAVFGLHLRGQPLNHQLIDLGASFVRSGKTAPTYRLYAINGRGPSKPGAIYVGDGSGAAIDLEIWSMPVEKLGHFVRMIPSPLGIGTVKLEDGSEVKGFICEAFIAAEAEEITQFGGWLAYRAAQKG